MRVGHGSVDLTITTRSPVFNRMLKTDMEEARRGVMDIPDMEPAVVAKFLEFVYTGAVVEVEEHLEDLLNAGDKYEVDALVSWDSDTGLLHLLAGAHVFPPHRKDEGEAGDSRKNPCPGGQTQPDHHQTEGHPEDP